jgi:SagB-type dehydrogenase family enzyme
LVGLILMADALVLADTHVLPPPRMDGALERLLSTRHSLREFSPRALTIGQAGQLLWAGQGQVSGDGRRTAPSAGARYPLSLLLIVGDVEGFSPGVYRYEPGPHRLVQLHVGDVRSALAAAALDQEWLARAPAIIAVAATERRTTQKYGPRGARYVHMEAGHVAQNVLLQATALGLGGAPVGAFDDDAVAKLLRLNRDEQPLYLLPVGRP